MTGMPKEELARLVKQLQDEKSVRFVAPSRPNKSKDQIETRSNARGRCGRPGGVRSTPVRSRLEASPCPISSTPAIHPRENRAETPRA